MQRAKRGELQHHLHRHNHHHYHDQLITKMIADQVYTKMMLSGLEEGVAAVERERARVTKIISDKVAFSSSSCS